MSPQCLGRIVKGAVHLRPLLRRHPRDRRVLEYTSIEELHDVEVAAHHALILAECVGLGHGDVGLLEGVDDAVLAVDLVRSLRAPSSACFLHMNGVGNTHFRQELARRLLPHDEFLAIPVRQLVCWVGLAVAELLTTSISLTSFTLCS